MESLIVDIENELKFISGEMESVKRKKQKLRDEKDPENTDSHIKAIALILHSIYTGYEKILEIIIKGIDGDLPTAVDYHTALLKRATYEIPDLRPAIISDETFGELNMLRAYRHKLRKTYTYLISPDKILELTEKALELWKLFNTDWEIFKKCISE